MKTDKISYFDEPEKIVLDFLNYLEKETNLSFDIASFSGLTQYHDLNDGSKDFPNIPVKFHFVKIKPFSLEMVLPFCEWECCNKISYLQILTRGEDQKKEAEIVKRQIQQSNPYMKVFLTNKLSQLI